MSNWKSVFDNYPKVDEIYIVDGMPFINERHAQSHSNSTGKSIQTVKRKDVKSEEGKGGAGGNATGETGDVDKKQGSEGADDSGKKPGRKNTNKA